MKKIADKWHLAALCCGFFLCLTGCGQKDIPVRIVDGQVETRLSVKSGITVEEALREADIIPEEGDIVSPSLTMAVTEDSTEILIERYTKVTVMKKGYSVQDVELIGKRVKDAISSAGIKLEKNDYVNYDLEAYLTKGMNIRIEPRYEVKMLVDGERRECLTGADSVAEFLKEQGIRLDEKDKITPGLDEGLADGMRIVVQRVSVKRITERESVDYETLIEYSANMYEDETVEKQPGESGEKEVIYEITYVDGKEENRRMIKETTIREPVSCILTKGTVARRRIVSRQQVFDCDGSGHGYYIITWSDGTVEYQDF
ncbi:MAG: ubiquitin-like domain-containing protein [Bacteroidales bacterium]|nr:ubiquitin-like domain-containing protein [Clostridium sp.]MCM1203345.1 ubiquitin-like domain-containing protein [Bacteroidales bacterium]